MFRELVNVRYSARKFADVPLFRTMQADTLTLTRTRTRTRTRTLTPTLTLTLT